MNGEKLHKKSTTLIIKIQREYFTGPTLNQGTFTNRRLRIKVLQSSISLRIVALSLLHTKHMVAPFI
jgi:hypothetical protein